MAESDERHAQRRPRALFVECRTGALRLEGRTKDISRSGAQLEFTDPSPLAEGTKDLGEFLAALPERLGKGFELSFGGGALTVKASLIRAMLLADGSGSISVGCSFEAPLTDAQCALLGIDAPTAPPGSASHRSKAR